MTITTPEIDITDEAVLRKLESEWKFTCVTPYSRDPNEHLAYHQRMTGVARLERHQDGQMALHVRADGCSVSPFTAPVVRIRGGKCGTVATVGIKLDDRFVHAYWALYSDIPLVR